MSDQKTQQLTIVQNNLQKLIENKQDALPKGFNKTRFIQNCMVVLQDTKEIEKCNPISVARTMLKGAFLGLDFFNKECYAIPYGGNLQFQTDYKGEKKLAKKYSVNPVRDIYAKLVRKGDEYQIEVVDGKQTLQYKPIPFNDSEIVGAFAVVLFEDGSMMVDDMSSAEIEATRKNYSKQSNGQAWTKSPGEMYKKTVLRRLCKNIELDFDSIEQRKVFEDAADFEFNKDDKKSQQSSPLNEDNIIEAGYEIQDEISEEEKERILMEEAEGGENA
jgi:recombination protein RecT